MALIGDRGTGKTTVAAACIHAVAAETPDPGPGRPDPNPIYATIHGLMLSIREAMGKPDASERSAVAAVIGVPLLVIDEAHERAGSDWEARTLTHIVVSREAELRPTLLVGCARPDALIAAVGPSIASRLSGAGSVFVLSGPSHRGRQ